MAWTGLTFSVGQILTAAQMNNLQGNFAGMADADPGAPTIDPINAMNHQGAAGAIGTYILAGGVNSTVAFGATTAGSNLQPAGVPGEVDGANPSITSLFSGATQSGTWRCMGYLPYDAGAITESNGLTLWLRIA